MKTLLATVALIAIGGCTSTLPAPTERAVSTTSSSPTPSTPPAPPATVPSTTLPSVFPATVLGLPVHTVEEAQRLVAAGAVDGRLIAIGGYWSQALISCPALPHKAMLDTFCDGVEFTDVPHAVTNGIGDPNAPTVVPETTSGHALYDSMREGMAGAVVVVAHARDSRSWQCSPGESRANCARKLVIDRVAWVNGTAMPDPPAPDVALTSGEKLVTAYQVDSAGVEDIDPRLVGEIPADAWYVRVMSGPPDPEGLADGLVRVLDAAGVATLAELPMVVSSDFRPSRVTFELAEKSHYEKGWRSQVDVIKSSVRLFTDSVGWFSSSLVVSSGTYTLHGWAVNDNNGWPFEGVGCDYDVDLKPDTDVAFTADYTKTGCSWAPTEPQS